MRFLHAATAVTLLAGSSALRAQGLAVASTAGAERSSPRAARSTAAQASAIRATAAPVIDGRADDAVWATAPRIDGFKVYDPEEGRTPSDPTIAQVAYDDHNLYILVHAFEPSRDSIRALMSRRDVRTPSDWIRVMVDSYHDKRTAYEFMVNPAGVKRDIYAFNDGDEDVSWDAVWHVATSVDSTGWTAEFSIPWSQLRYPATPEHVIGLMISREVGRRNERQSWPLLSRNRTGFVSQFGEVSGIKGLPSNHRLEVMPYVVQKGQNLQRAAGDYAQHGSLSAGADLKYGLTSNLTVDATINPDFGQVEADPATYNLGTTELFFSERRPFFMEGMGIFRFDLNCNDGECTGLFYSRRVGQAPLLGGEFGNAGAPASTTILGAAKLTGRLGSGLSVGLLDAATQREFGAPRLDTVQVNGRDSVRARGDQFVIQPATNYVVARAQQELRGGQTVIGFMGTGVTRALGDSITDARLRREAYSAGIDFNSRFAHQSWALGGYAAGSLVRGSADAIARTQASAVHGYTRVGSGLDYDPTRTALSGGTAQLGLQKISGRTRLFTGFTRTSEGFEINDAGFLGRADQQMYSTWIGWRFNKPRAFYRMLGLNFNQWDVWNTAGRALDYGGNINGHSQLKNNWFVFAGTGMGQFASINDRDARGGPAFRESPSMNNWVGFETDGRKPVQGSFNVNHMRGDYGHTRFASISQSITVRPSSRYSVSVGPRFSRNIDDSQWYDNPIDDAGATHYVFGHLDQKVLSLTSRLDFAATPTLSVQLYAAPFVTTGRFTDLRQLSSNPLAPSYDDRYAPYLVNGAQPDGGGFNYKQFNSNAVMRWEYRPGSALFLVWSQGRVQDGLNPGSFEPGRDSRDLFRAHPQNTLLIKGSYWLSL